MDTYKEHRKSWATKLELSDIRYQLFIGSKLPVLEKLDFIDLLLHIPFGSHKKPFVMCYKVVKVVVYYVLTLFLRQGN